MDIKNKIALRKDCNFILENVVNLKLQLSPDLRYIQCLWVLGIIDTKEYRDGVEIADRFSEEPYDTVVRILHHIVKLISGLDESSDMTHKLLGVNIIKGLKDLGLVTQEGPFKIIPNN